MFDEGIPAGILAEGSPLHVYLARIFRQYEGGTHGFAPLELKILDSKRSVYVCEEAGSGCRLICKFFGARSETPSGERRNLLLHEYSCLQSLRAQGFDREPFLVVAPRGRSEDLGCLLTEEFVSGPDLDHYIAQACYNGKSNTLIAKLQLVAGFLARLHRLPASLPFRDFSVPVEYLRSVGRVLTQSAVTTTGWYRRLAELARHWENDRRMWLQPGCHIHGDATPTNFILGEDRLTAIDLERACLADPAHDTGFVMAELKHHFALRIYNAAAAEPLIGNFLDSYEREAERSIDDLEDLSFRSRFYMALGELRIARNPWLPLAHRRWLAAEALRCLA